MSQPARESLLETIQKLTYDLGIIDDQIQAVGVEGMNQLLPMRYFALQPQVDRLATKRQALQDAWNRAMNELAICRSDELSPYHP